MKLHCPFVVPTMGGLFGTGSSTSAILKSRWHSLSAIVLFALNVSSTPASQLVTARGDAFPPQAGGNGNSGLAVASQDGRYVLFASTANNLTLTHDTNLPPLRPFNVYLRDRLAGTTSLVSVNAAGNGVGNGALPPPASRHIGWDAAGVQDFKWLQARTSDQ